MSFGWDYVLSLAFTILFWSEVDNVKSSTIAGVSWMAGNICFITFIVLFFLNIFYPLYLLKDIF